MIDKLIDRIIELQNPTVVGLDPKISYIGCANDSNPDTFEKAASMIFDFNREIIDEICDIVPAVKPQLAYYEQYGVAGVQAFYRTVTYAKEKGLIVITDGKRNDIGSTASCYADAYLGATELFNKDSDEAFPSDFLTVNGYLGSDGVLPFVKNCKSFDRGIFVLCKTSNPSGKEIQDVILENGKKLYEHIGRLIGDWGEDSVGKYGYSDVGAVVGATYPEQAERLRAELPHTFFLVPGYGAQGGLAEDLAVCFDNRGLGAVVNSSRGIICASSKEKYRGLSVGEAARAACIDMKNDICSAVLKKYGIEKIG